jgi:hypothetical protein
LLLHYDHHPLLKITKTRCRRTTEIHPHTTLESVLTEFISKTMNQKTRLFLLDQL